MAPFDRRLFSHLNWPLLGFTLALFLLGIINLYSAGSLRLEQGVTTIHFYQKQLIWGSLGLLIMLICMSFDYRHLKNIIWPLYFLSLSLLLAVIAFGHSISGAKRWLDFGVFNFQPTEMAKVAVLLILARFLSRSQAPLTWKPFFKISGLILIPSGLIIIQPDLGSGLNLLLIAMGVILFKGLDKKIILTGVLVLPILMPTCWHYLHDYQKQRILTFIHPEKDPLGSGYNIIQSQIAIGSGKLWGKGFLEGTQSQLKFLPEKHTDFVFAVFGEEWGFIGCITLLSLFCLFLYQLISTIQTSKDEFGSLLTVGIFFYFFWQIIINMSMVLGLMPVVGIPLPFLSYGGSSTLVNFALLGLALNVSMRRYVFKQS